MLPFGLGQETTLVRARDPDVLEGEKFLGFRGVHHEQPACGTFSQRSEDSVAVDHVRMSGLGIHRTCLFLGVRRRGWVASGTDRRSTTLEIRHE